MDELDKAVEQDRLEHEKKLLKKKESSDDNDDNNPSAKNIKQSTTDPESGFMHRDGKPKGFFYLDHRTVNSKLNIITEVFVTPGNVNDIEPYIERLNLQKEKFNFEAEAVGLDTGYNTIIKIKSNNYISLRFSSAFIKVTSSANSRLAPTGNP